jgi:hypothetical protein
MIGGMICPGGTFKEKLNDAGPGSREEFTAA